MAVITYDQGNAAPTLCTFVQSWCSGLSVVLTGFTTQAVDGGGLGGSTRYVVEVVGQALEIGIVWLIENPTSWAAGDWEVNLEVSNRPTPIGPLSWARINICHVLLGVPSPCTSIATMGTLLGPSIPCNPGTKTGTVVGASGVASPGPNDGIAVVLGFFSSGGTMNFSAFSRLTITHTEALVTGTPMHYFRRRKAG